MRLQESSSQAVARRAIGKQSPLNLEGEGGMEGHVQPFIRKLALASNKRGDSD